MQDYQIFYTCLQWIGKHILEFCVILSIFFEITPIKFNPISGLIKLLFKPIQKDMDNLKDDLNKKIDNMNNDIKKEILSIKNEQLDEKRVIGELNKSIDLSEIIRLRWEIREFGTSLDNNQLHKREEYLQIIDDNTRYHELIKKYNLINGYIDDDINKIKDHYENYKNSNNVYF